MHVAEFFDTLMLGPNVEVAYAGFNKVSSDLQAVAIGATNLLFTMLAMWDGGLSRRCRRYLLYAEPSGFSGMAAYRLHRLFRIFAGRGHLGFY
jgi:hypothetical protein